MSCVVALKDHGSIYLASDSLIETDYGYVEQNMPKFSMSGGNDKLVWFGFSGRARFFQIMKNIPILYSEAVNIDNVVEWTGHVKSHIPEDFKFTCMVVGNNSIFTFDSDRYVIEHTVKYYAIGSGAKWALGALDAMPDEYSPMRKVRMAIEIAKKRDVSGCGGEIHTQIV